MVPSMMRNAGMTSTRLTPHGALLLGLALLAAACGPRPTESPPIQRGTALPPPGVELPVRR